MKFDNNPFTLTDKTIIIPNDTILERTVLGLMITSPDALEVGMQHLEASYFPNIDNNNRAIFHAMKLLHEESVNVDIVTVSGKLKELRLFSAVGGLEYLSSIAEEAITYSAIKDYCLSLRDLDLLRKALKVMDTGIEKHRQGQVGDVNDYLSDLLRDVTKVAEERRIMDFESLGDIARDLKAHLEKMQKSGSKLTGSRTGFSDLDQFTHGFQEDNYIIIAARPAVGKTAFGLSLAYNMAKLNERAVGFFSLEMGNQQLMQRLVSKVSGVLHKNIMTGYLNKTERVKVYETLENLKHVKLYIDETPGININDLLIKARKLKRENDDLCAIFVDYIGLITTSGPVESRQIQLSEISAALKGLARELNISVIALSQLSRAVEATKDKMPQMSHLRESGSLEQDADLVFLMYREDYYVKQGTIKPIDATYQSYYETLARATEESKDPSKNLDVSPVDIILAKNRSGETGVATLLFFKAISSFDNPSPELTKLFTSARKEKGSNYSE